MTGFGEARRQADDVAVAVELRTVNNRYFKFSLRIRGLQQRLSRKSNRWSAIR